MSTVPKLATANAARAVSLRAGNMLAFLLGLTLLLSAAFASAVPIGFTPAASMLLGRYSQVSAVLDNGKVLVAGGRDTSYNYSTSAELYDPSTNSWASTGSMGTARTEAVMVKLADGKVLVAGGFVPNVQLRTAELYDPVAGTWSGAASMAGGRVGASGVLLGNGKALIVGGGSADVYDPVANSWTATGAMAGSGGNYHSLTVLQNGKVLAAGGTGAGYVATANLYDPASNTWTATGSMITARGVHGAALLANGKVLVAGGVTGNGSVFLASAELYDPAAGTWAAAGSMAQQRDLHSATALSDGKVLVVAGQKVTQGATMMDPNITTLYTSAELYDPATNAWTAAGDLTARRYGHVAQLLANGKVLIAVGVDTSIGALSSAQLWDPTAASVPDAPVIGTATSGNAQATVTFTAPANNGGNAISGYTVTSNPAGGVDSNAGTTGLSHVVTGLTIGTAYTFTVTATNGAGTSAASSASNSVTPTGPPGAPVIGTATAGNAQATVTFTAPVSNGGSAIAGYSVTSSPAGGVDSNAGSTGLSHVVTGLANGTAYTFTATATNANGAGVASAASNSVTPSTVPGAPVIGTATAGIAQATVTFTAPASNGGATITGYTVTSNPAGGVDSNAGSTGLGHVITGLVNGTPYTFTVRASNANGAGVASAASNSVTPFTTYGVSYSGNGATSGSVPVDAASYAAGATVTVLGNSGNLIKAGGTFSGWNMQANGSGTAQAAASTFTMPAANVTLYAQFFNLPGAPTIGTATAGGQRATVSFAPPANNGGMAISSYTVTCSASGQATQSNTGATSPITVYRLTAEVNYSCSVTATNGAGTGAPSAPVLVTPQKSYNSAPIWELLLG